jgi:hypothetical protein
MTDSSRQSRSSAEIRVTLVAAAVPVVAVAVIGARTQIAPAIAIGAIIAIAELALDRRHDRITYLTRLAAERPTGAAGHLASAAPAGLRVATHADPAEAVAPVPVPLRQFMASDRRVDDPQCPRCGRFLIDVSGAGSSEFGCRACGWSWQWLPGQPWPDVTIVPNLHALPDGPPATT